MNTNHDLLGRRSRDRRAPSSTRIGLTSRNLLWFEKLHRHGPLSSTFLLAYCQSTHRSKGRAKDRLTQLYHEAGKHGDAYLERPWQQFATHGARYHDLVYDLTDAGRRALKEAGRLREHVPAPIGPWVHRYMIAAVTASIELATLRTRHLRYIFQDEILGRAETALRFPVTADGVTSDLIPDALFGLEYQADGRKLYRFFIVEADRGTEPANANASRRRRKSYERTVRQYREFVGKGQYKNVLRLTAGMVVLNVTTSEARMQNLIGLTGKLSEGGRNSYMLFAALPASSEVRGVEQASAGFCLIERDERFGARGRRTHRRAKSRPSSRVPQWRRERTQRSAPQTTKPASRAWRGGRRYAGARLHASSPASRAVRCSVSRSSSGGLSGISPAL